MTVYSVTAESTTRPPYTTPVDATNLSTTVRLRAAGADRSFLIEITFKGWAVNHDARPGSSVVEWTNPT
jgi:hypothetical protein